MGNSRSALGVFLLLLGFGAPTVQTQPKSGPKELAKAAESLVQAATLGNREPFEKLRIPDPDSWFADAFGDRAGPHIGRIYGRIAPEMPGMVHKRFLQISSQASLKFEAASWKSFKGLERTRQPATLAVWAVSSHPEELFALWFTANGAPKSFLGFWCYADGEFRFVGWLYVVRAKTAESIVLLPPDAEIREVAKLDKNPAPSYPPLARRAMIQGTVGLKAIVTSNGTLEDVAVLHGHPLLVQSSLDAVRKWRFTPLMVNGQVLEAVLVIEVHYTLSS